VSPEFRSTTHRCVDFRDTSKPIYCSMVTLLHGSLGLLFTDPVILTRSVTSRDYGHVTGIQEYSFLEITSVPTGAAMST
jgi:hypothetical protein